MNQPRPWIHWLLLWGLLLGTWWGAERWGPAAPWLDVTATLRPLQPRLPLQVGTTDREHTPSWGAANESWAFLDTLDLDIPTSWQLKGGARAWFPLRRFFLRLPQADQQRVEVYHWGDSQIEGDRISKVLRKRWQSKWGGRGPGWVLPLTPASNTAIVGSLKAGSMGRSSGFGRGRDPEALRLPFFAVNDVSDTAIWTVRGNGRSSLTHKGWTRTDLWAEAPGTVRLAEATEATSADSLSWTHAPVMGDLTLTLSPQRIQGIFLGQSHGVYVHNLPMRGSSGTLFDKIPASDWQRLKDTHAPSLLLLQFGGNAVPGIQTAQEARWFAKRLANNIRFLERTFPGIPIVFIGPSDMGKSPSTFPGLPLVIDALAAEIASTSALHWDLQAAMGGPGSMAAWVERGWASDDHIHFTRRGAQEAGERLELALLAAWKSLRTP